MPGRSRMSDFGCRISGALSLAASTCDVHENTRNPTSEIRHPSSSGHPKSDILFLPLSCSYMRWPICVAALLLTRISFGSPKVVAVNVNGIIHPVTVEIVSRAIDQAKRENADAILLRINTPGGLMEAMRETVEKIVASPVPVITYVTPSGGRAASAGFFILEAGDVSAMAPGTNTGAAHPVLISGQMDPEMKQKVENDAAASLRSLAQKRGRNSALAEKAVLESKSFTEKEALENRLIEFIARDEQDLFKQLDGREIVRFDGRKQMLRLAGA